jgi:exosortase/archaeosortase family protein
MPNNLNARIGRTMPSPLLLLTPARRAGIAARPRIVTRGWLLAALLAALWPHWHYVARRMTDGSDEPWGVLALATVVLLLAAEGRLDEPTRAALVASAVLALLAAIASLALPDLAAAAIAMLALGVYLVHALRDRPASALVALLLLALPIIASLQFYLGYPLRVASGDVALVLLRLGGAAVAREGVHLRAGGALVMIDAPCSGIRMLWAALLLACCLAALFRLRTRGSLLAVGAAVVVTVAGNGLRTAALFWADTNGPPLPSFAHAGVGVVVFAMAAGALVAVTRALAAREGRACAPSAST